MDIRNLPVKIIGHTNVAGQGAVHGRGAGVGSAGGQLSLGPDAAQHAELFWAVVAELCDAKDSRVALAAALGRGIESLRSLQVVLVMDGKLEI